VALYFSFRHPGSRNFSVSVYHASLISSIRNTTKTIEVEHNATNNTKGGCYKIGFSEKLEMKKVAENCTIKRFSATFSWVRWVECAFCNSLFFTDEVT